jgi:hypothetical protein
LTTGYEKPQDRQKYLEYMFDKKISNDIHNIQQILDNMTKQAEEGDQNNKACNTTESKQSYSAMLMYNSY